ncbi:MAG TPA: hypothetical protein VGM39_21145 [Kofleriaceae bacterium]|jgi:hypothetical protein
MTELDRLIDDRHARIDAIAHHLDALSADERWRQASMLDRDRQRTLFEKAAHATPIDVAHFVQAAQPREEVIHDGVNTLPMPAPLRRFQKRFCLPPGQSAQTADRLPGYNHGPTLGVVGPGYFVAIATADRPAWAARGAIVVDYFQIPAPDEVPASWPPIVENSWRLQRFVYHQTRDFMRRVSHHVSVGAAYKRERSLDHFFVLCRRDR